VRSGETMHFRASYVTGYVTGSCVIGTYDTDSRAASIGARAISWLGLIAAMMVYCYSPPLRAMEETLVVTIDQMQSSTTS